MSEAPILENPPLPPHNDSDGNDAVCFCAGLSGAYFGAGVIHAYLASQRRAPKVAAGISAGALSAAAMQKCYAELEKEPPQGVAVDCDADKKQRWAWFRTYIHALTDNPFGVFWDAIPEISDFFADMPPIKDTSLPRGETAARRQRYILIKLGRWVADLRISVRTFAETAVYYVRWKEGYGSFSGLRCLSRVLYLLLRLCFAIAAPSKEMWFREYLFEEEGPGKKLSIWQFLRPLFGWKIYLMTFILALLCVVAMAALLSLAASLILSKNLLMVSNLHLLAWSFLVAAVLQWVVLRYILDVECFPPQSSGRQHLRTMAGLFPLMLILWGILAWPICWIWNCRVPNLNAWDSMVKGWTHYATSLNLVSIAGRNTVVLLVIFVVVFVGGWFYRWRKAEKTRRSKNDNKPSFMDALLALPQHLAQEIGIKQELITDFYLLVKLRRLFDPDSLHSDKDGNDDKAYKEKVKDKPMALVLAAAPLQTIRRHGKAAPAQQLWARKDTKLVMALRAALALPGLTRPLVATDPKKQWGCDLHKGQQLNLVDGSVICANPIPALFDFLQTEAKTAAGKPIAHSLETDDERDCRLHVVYTVPMAARKLKPGAKINFNGDIVDVAALSINLSHRRDIRLEMDQTRLISKVEKLARPSMGPVNLGDTSSNVRFRIFPDAIAPETDISLGEPLQPDRNKCLAVMSAGCRQTLRTLYAAELPVNCKTITCQELFAKLWKVDAVQERPGVGEICSKCSGRLTRQEPPKKKRMELNSETFTNLTGERPRIIFVASGGVFRGAFQAGILAALLQAGIRVDLVVGASVGTLLGSVLGAAQCEKGYTSFLPIYQLVELFVHADEKIALTTTLKGAMREIGLRAKSIKLSPHEVQRMIQRGSRFDPGFAAVGAPPALLDAISTLLALPFNATKEAAASLTSGAIAKSVGDMLKCVREHTLTRLGIEKFIMGVSLLEPEARKLLLTPTAENVNLNCPQPFLDAGKVALFATTTNLMTWESKLLGDPSECVGSYDFVEAALSSSAFPAVFQPRREADVYPGLGSEAIVYADGGMFDNVPFIPALQILSSVQRSYVEKSSKNKAIDALEFLRKRYNNRDLIIAGSLNVNPEDEDNQSTFDSIVEVSKRAKILDANIKIRDFEMTSTRVHRQIEQLLEYYDTTHSAITELSKKDIHFINGIVDSAVLPVFPSSPKHLNGTFSFCRTLGLKSERIFISVANGCHNTLEALAKAQATPDNLKDGASNSGQLMAKSIKVLTRGERILAIKRIPNPDLKISKRDSQCPFFTISGTKYDCPFKTAESANFAEATGVYCACITDKVHKSAKPRLPVATRRKR